MRRRRVTCRRGVACRARTRRHAGGGHRRRASCILRRRPAATAGRRSRPARGAQRAPLPTTRRLRVPLRSTAAGASTRARTGSRATRNAAAKALQRSLLTEPLRSSGCRSPCGTDRWRSGRGSAGDWYDAFLGLDGQLNVRAGDVMGHDQMLGRRDGPAPQRPAWGGVDVEDGSPAAVLHALDCVAAGLCRETCNHRGARRRRTRCSCRMRRIDHRRADIVVRRRCAGRARLCWYPLLGLGEPAW